MTNIRGSYQAAMYEPDDDIPRRNNGVQHHQQHQHHVVNMVPADPVRSRQDLMEFGQTMKSKIKGLTYEDERDHLLNRIADKRPEIIGGTGCPEQDLLTDDSDDGIGMCGWILTAISWAMVLATLPFSLCVCFKVVQEYERAVIFRLGRLLSGGSKGPGIFFVLPCIETYQKVDLRTITLDVPPQEVLTRDSVTVSVDAVVYYRVSNATISVANVENAHHSTRLLAQTTLRNILGTKTLHEILGERESISSSMQTVLDEATEPWGIKVERVEIKDARLPEQLQRAMAAEAEASREARAKVIAADGEMRASKALREASQIIEQSPAALQLRYLQTLNSISSEKNSTIVFPLPMDMMSVFQKKMS